MCACVCVRVHVHGRLCLCAPRLGELGTDSLTLSLGLRSTFARAKQARKAGCVHGRARGRPTCRVCVVEEEAVVQLERVVAAGVWGCVCVCVRACVRACVCACVRARV